MRHDSATKRIVLAVLAAVVVFGTLFIAPTDSVSALTTLDEAGRAKCRDLAFKLQNAGKASAAAKKNYDAAGCDASSGGICTFNSTGYHCDTEAEVAAAKEAEAIKDATKKAAAQKVQPFITKICEPAPNPGSPRLVELYSECITKVTNDYNSCNTTGGGRTGEMEPTPEQFATCFIAKYPSLTTAEIKSLYSTGQADAEKTTDQVLKDAQNERDKSACTTSGGTWDAAKTPPCTKADAKGTSTCSPEIGAMGWIICPVMRFLGDMTDGLYTHIIEAFLNIKVDFFSTSSSTYKAWESFRTWGNVFLVLIFMFLIYSQVTTIGISNYGIKKLLPKLIIVAILINASFYLCQFAVDLSNVTGKALFNTMDGVQGVTNYSTSKTGAIVNDILVGAVAGTAIVGFTIVVGIGALLPVLLAALAAMVVTFLILVGRQAAIIVLIAMSPIAFAAYLLPNTEALFKKWWKMFSGLLIVYPTIALMFGAAKLAAGILYGDGKDFFMGVAAIAASMVPLIITPSLLRGSMNATGQIGAKLSGAAAGLSKQSGSSLKQGFKESSPYQGVSQALQHRKQQTMIRRAGKRSGASGGMGKIYNAFGGKGYAGRRATQGVALKNEEDKKAADEAEALMKSEMGPAGVLDDGEHGAQARLEAALASGDTAKTRAATKLLLASGAPGRERVRRALNNHQQTQGFDANTAAYRGMQSELNSANLKGSDNVLATAGYTTPRTAADGSTTGTIAEIAGSASTNRGLTNAEMAGQSFDDIEHAITSRTLSAKSAYDMLHNDTISGGLSEDKKRVLGAHAAGYTPPAPPSQRPPQAPPPPVPQNPQAQQGQSRPNNGTQPSPPPASPSQSGIPFN